MSLPPMTLFGLGWKRRKKNEQQLSIHKKKSED